MKFLKFATPTILSLVIFGLVVYLVEPPKSLSSANLIQIALFFIPLLSLITSISNFYFKYWIKSLAFGIGITLLLALKGLDTLNIITGAVAISALFLILRSLKSPVQTHQALRSPRVLKLKRQ